MNPEYALDKKQEVVPRMGFSDCMEIMQSFEPMNSYENGFLIRVWRLVIDLESIAVDRAWLSRLNLPEIALVYSHFGASVPSHF